MKLAYLKRLQIFIVMCVFITPSFLFAVGNAAEGKKKAAVCAACHGAQGISSNPLWPNLAGQKDQYILKQLKAFKSGARKEPTMFPFIQNLTDIDFKNLAAYFSSLSPGK